MRYNLWSNRRRVVVGDAEETLFHGAGASHPASSDKKSAVIPTPATLDDVCAALRRQQLVELRLGWHEGPELASYGKGCRWLKSHRHVQQLVRALQANKSLKHLWLGWRIRHRGWIADILDAFRVSSAALETFQLVLHHNVHWLPEESFKSFLVNQTHLVSIDLQCVRAVLPANRTGCGCGHYYASRQSPDRLRHRPGSSHNSRLPPSSTTAPPPLPRQCGRDHGVISRVVVHLFRHDRLKSLQLADCSVTNRQANQLADYLHIRGGLARLSLRKNARTLTGDGVRDLCQSPVLERLDLSLCDLGTREVRAAADSLAKRPWPLRELALSGNYRVGASGWAALASRACCDRVVCLDLSYCDIGPAKAVHLLGALERNLSATTALQQLNLQGCQLSWNSRRRNRPGEGHVEEAEAYASRGGGDGSGAAADDDRNEDEGTVGCPSGGVSEALSRLLRRNNSLRVVRLNDPSRPNRSCPMSSSDLAQVLDALEHNYELEVLQVDHDSVGVVRSVLPDDGPAPLSSSSSSPLWAQLDFVMRLNRAGRRVLLGRRSWTPHDWYYRATAGSTSTTGSPPSFAIAPHSLPRLPALPSDRDAWLQVLADAAAGPATEPDADWDVLFWLVRESADRFGSAAAAAAAAAARSPATTA